MLNIQRRQNELNKYELFYSRVAGCQSSSSGSSSSSNFIKYQAKTAVILMVHFNIKKI